MIKNSFSGTDKITKETIKKAKANLRNTISYLYVIVIYRILQSILPFCALFSECIEHLFGHIIL